MTKCRTDGTSATHVQPGDVSHALIQQGERERLRKTPSAAAQRRGGGGGAWQSCRALPSTAGEEEGEMQGCAIERSKLLCLLPPNPQVYIGEEGRLRPHLGFHPRGGGQPQNPSRVRPR